MCISGADEDLDHLFFQLLLCQELLGEDWHTLEHKPRFKFASGPCQAAAEHTVFHGSGDYCSLGDLEDQE